MKKITVESKPGRIKESVAYDLGKLIVLAFERNPALREDFERWCQSEEGKKYA